MIERSGEAVQRPVGDDCVHLSISTYCYVEGPNRGEPAGLWACAECHRKFVPLDLAETQRSSLDEQTK